MTGARRSEPVTGENTWIELRSRFAPRERALVSARPQTLFKPVRLVTPVSPLRFVLSGVLVPPGVEVPLPDHGIQHAHLGDAVVFEVWNEGDQEEELDVRVYGISPPQTGGAPRSGQVGFAGASGKAPS